MEILRKKELTILTHRFASSPIVAILGPRQCGKTTLAKQFLQRHKSKPIHFFDLENPRDLSRLDNPLLCLEGLKGIVIIDEIQRKPDLFPVLRVLVDKYPSVQYLILGSASRDLIAQSSETLAGRISYLEINGFTIEHLPLSNAQRLWIRGGFPRSYLARNEAASSQWRHDFIATFLERDLPNLGIHIPARAMHRFWIMLAHYHGQVFNASEIGRSFGASDHTMRRYLDLLTGTFLVRQLQPWHYNTKKRLVKRPKLYFRDSGLFHAILGLDTRQDVLTHPKLGASWEGFALEQVIACLGLKEEEAFFWSTHAAAELDLVYVKKGRLWGVEVKYQDAPKQTKSTQTALDELSLAHLWIVYPGKKTYPLNKKTTALAFDDIPRLLGNP